jgi:hypothetical protein
MTDSELPDCVQRVHDLADVFTGVPRVPAWHTMPAALTPAERGAQLLDQEYPGWADKVNLDVLDMASCHWCVAGQQDEFGAVVFRLRHATGDREPRFVSRYGFDTYGNEPYEPLEAEWRRLIAARTSK